MKMILLLINIPLLVILTAIPVLKKINLARLITMIMLLLYTVAMIKLIMLYPIRCLSFLVLGTVILMFIASLFRKNATGLGNAGDEKIRILHWQKGIRAKSRSAEIRKEWILS